MAPMLHVFSTVFFFFVLLNFKSEARNMNPPVQSAASAPESSQCAKEYVEEHMRITAQNTKEFLTKELRKRLDDRNTMDAERTCLMSCFQAYEKAGESLVRGANNVSQGKYYEAAQDMVGYSQNIAPCIQCSAQNLSQDAELMHYQKVARTSAEDLLNKLQSCQRISKEHA